MPPADPGKPGLAKFLKELVLDLAPVTGEIRSGMAAKEDFKKGRYGWGTLNALGAIPLLGMAGRGLKFVHGADIVARAVKEMRAADELEKTAKLITRAPKDVEVAKRTLRRGEQIDIPTENLRRYEPRSDTPEPPKVEDIIGKMVDVGAYPAEALSNVRGFLSRSKFKQVFYRGDILDPDEAMFPVFSKTNDLGYHVGTAGQASTIKEMNNPEAIRAVERILNERFGGPTGWNMKAFKEFVSSPEGKRIVEEAGGSTMPQVGHRVTPVAVNVERPMILSDQGMWDPAETIIDIERRGYVDRHGVEPIAWAERVDDVLADRWNDPGETRTKFWDLLDDLGMGRLGRKGGTVSNQPYDAIQYLNIAEDLPHYSQGHRDVTSGWSLMVPQSQQIKALLGNEGTFSRWNPNIFKTVAGTAGAGLLGSAMLKDRENDGN